MQKQIASNLQKETIGDLSVLINRTFNQIIIN